MASIKETAKTTELNLIKNISELKEVSVDLDITESVETTKDGEEYTINKITVNDEDYRVPITVLTQLKVLIEDDDTIKKFKVLKSGEGKTGTKYNVVPLK